MSTKVSKRYMGVMLVITLALVLAMPAQFVRADGPVALVDNLQASWTAPGGGGVWASYSGPPAYDMVSPGITALYDGREAGVIKAGLAVDPASGHYEDDGIFGFKPTVTIDDFAGGALTYDVVNQEGTNPVWMTIEIDTGVVDNRSDNTTYQHVPTSNPAGWHTVDAGAGQWQKWNNNDGDVTGSALLPLSDVATAHTGLSVVRAFLRLGIGDSYHGTGSGTVAWVDKATLGGVTYDFVLPAYWYVAPTGLDTNEGTAASPFLTIQHAIDAASPGDTIHVAAGTYTETLSLVDKDNLTIEGAGEGSTIIDAHSSLGYGWDLRADGVELSDFTFVGPTAGTYGIKVSGNSPVPAAGFSIHNVTIQNSKKSALDINGVNGVTITDVTVTDTVSGSGIALTDVNNATLTNITTSGNTWGSIAVMTYGRWFPGGSDNLTLTNITSTEPIYTEVANYTTPASPYPVTNFTAGEFIYKVINLTDRPNHVYYTETQAQAAALAQLAAVFAHPDQSFVLNTTTGHYIVAPDMSIQAAVNAASTGNTIDITAGTHTLGSQVSLNKAGIALQGVGNPLIQVSGTGYRFLITASDVTLDGLRIQKTDTASVQNIISIQASNTTITNNEIFGQFVIGGGETTRALEVSGGITGLNISNNTIHNLRQPAYINGPVGGTVSNNYVYQTKGWVVAGGGVTFAGNTWGTGTNVNVYDIAIIASGAIPGNYPDIVAMSNANNGAVIEDQRVSPAVLSVVYVDAATSYTDDLGGRYHPYSTITPAIARLVAGGTIHVAAGTYPTGQIIISKSMSILGDPANKPVIHPNANITGTNASEAWFLVQSGVTFGLSNVVLDGDPYLVWQAIRSHGFTTIDSVDFRNIQGSTSGNPFKGFAVSSYGGIVAGGIGNDSHGGAGGPASDLTVTGSTFEDIGRVGVLVKGTLATAEITDNIYTGKGNGDWLDYAFEVGAGGNILVDGNTVSNNRGVATSSDGATSAGVLVTTYWGAGTEATIENNTFTGNTSAIAVGYDGTDTSVVTAHRNRFVGSTDVAVNSTAATVDAIENWWGSANPVWGSTVSAHVLYAPWCTNEDCTTFATLPVHNTIKDTYYATIQAAIDAADSGDTINVAAGTYPEQLNITKSLHLIGAGAGSSIVQAPATLPAAIQPTSAIVLISGSAVDTELTGFTVTGPGPSTSGSIRAGIFVRDGANANIHHNTIQDIRDNAVPLSGAQNGVAISVGRQLWTTSGTATIANNTIIGYQKGGIVVDNTGSNAIITNNTVTGAGTISITAQNGIQISRGATATLSGNTVTGNSYHLEGSTWNWGAAGILLWQAGDVTMAGGNIVTGNDQNLSNDSTALTLGAETLGNSTAPVEFGYDLGHYGTYALDATGVTFVGSADNFAIEDRVWHTIDEAGLGLVTWTPNNVYVTPLTDDYQAGSIQRGIDAVSAGGTVNVAAGTYTQTGQIVINKNLTLTGADKVTTILKPGQDTGAGGDARGWFLIQPGVTFNLNNVTMDGSGRLVAIAVLSYGNGVIENNIIKNIMHSQYYGRGIQLYDTNMTLRNNQLENIQRIGIFAYGSGVTGAVIDGNTYVGKGSGDWLDYGIELGGGAVAEVMNNTVSDNVGVASVDGSTSAGMLVSTYFGAGTTANVHDNTFMNNTAGLAVGYNASDTSTVVARHNQFTGNTDLALDSTAATVDARENWWGSAAPVWSSTVSDHVSYTPWCMDATCTTLSPEVVVLGVPSGTLTTWSNTFNWTGISGADFYQLEAYDGNDTLIYSQWYTTGICTGLDCAVSPAETQNLANGNYKWKVRTYGISGFGDWTTFTNFTLDVPTLSLTSPTGTLVNWNNTFSWTGISTADFYQLEVYDGSDTLAYSQWYTTSICTGLNCAVAPAETRSLANGDYRWKIRTYGSSGFTSWTDFTTFTLDVPTLSQIAPTGTLTTWNNTFSWTGIAAADFYQVEVSDTSDAVLYSQWYTTSICTGLDCAVSPVETQNLANGNYKWRVRTYGVTGFGNWTAFTNFTLNIPTLSLISPAGTLTSWSNTFSWTGISGADFYQIEVADASDVVLYSQWYTTGICTGLDCAVSPAEIQNLTNGDYKWKVRTYGTSGFTSWTNLTSFTLDAPEVVPVSPTATLTTWDNTFHWTGITGADYYRLQVYDVTGGMVIFDQWYTTSICTGLDCAVSPAETQNLANGDYQWRVQTYGVTGFSPWTAYMDFSLNR